MHVSPQYVISVYFKVHHDDIGRHIVVKHRIISVYFKAEEELIVASVKFKKTDVVLWCYKWVVGCDWISLLVGVGIEHLTGLIRSGAILW